MAARPRDDGLLRRPGGGAAAHRASSWCWFALAVVATAAVDLGSGSGPSSRSALPTATDLAVLGPSSPDAVAGWRRRGDARRDRAIHRAATRLRGGARGRAHARGRAGRPANARTPASGASSTWSRRWRSRPGLPVPALYVLPASRASTPSPPGFSPDRAVVAVTRGALDELTPRRAAGRRRPRALARAERRHAAEPAAPRADRRPHRAGRRRPAPGPHDRLRTRACGPGGAAGAAILAGRVLHLGGGVDRAPSSARSSARP